MKTLTQQTTVTHDHNGQEIQIRNIINDENNEPFKMWYEISLDGLKWFEFHAEWFDNLSQAIDDAIMEDITTVLNKVAAFLNGKDIIRIQSHMAHETDWAEPIKPQDEFSNWLDTFIEEKELNTAHIFEVEGPQWGLNIIPFDALIESIKAAPAHEKSQIKNMIVKIDFANGDVMHFFNHLAKAIAL